jgi:hypothetical protein
MSQDHITVQWPTYHIEIEHSNDGAYIEALERAPIGVHVIGKMPPDRTKAVMRIRQQMFKLGRGLRSEKTEDRLRLWCVPMPERIKHPYKLDDEL